MDEFNKMQEIMELQGMHQQMEELSKQLEALQEKQSAITITLNAIKELQTTKKGTEILAPIADGIFVKTTLENNTTAIVNIGKGITVEKKLPEVLEMVQGHEVSIAENTRTIETKMQEISTALLEKIAVLEMDQSNTEE